MKDLDKTQKKVLFFWLILAIVVLILFFLLRFFKIDFKRSNTYDKTYHLVEDYSRYYTVTATIDKLYQFLNAGSRESVLHILDSEYKEEKKLTEKNVISTLKNEKTSISFEARTMCEKRVKEDLTQYVVKGYKVDLNEIKKISEVFYQVVLDESNFHFSIRPIEEKTFSEVCHE